MLAFDVDQFTAVDAPFATATVATTVVWSPTTRVFVVGDTETDMTCGVGVGGVVPSPPPPQAKSDTVHNAIVHNEAARRMAGLGGKGSVLIKSTGKESS